ncbi:MAG: DUF3566 domain-containing protein [Anaerolineae bacterium]|nr:DUF3566 domain-containing protein [Anaerolineae bacterium]
MVTIKHINVGSAARVGAIVSLIVGAITGILLLALPSLVFSSLVNIATVVTNSGGTTTVQPTFNDAFATFSLVTMCITYGVSLVFSTIAGGIGGMLFAFAYNLSVRWVGGLEVELDPEIFGKTKRGADLDDIYE